MQSEWAALSFSCLRVRLPCARSRALIPAKCERPRLAKHPGLMRALRMVPATVRMEEVAVMGARKRRPTFVFNTDRIRRAAPARCGRSA